MFCNLHACRNLICLLRLDFSCQPFFEYFSFFVPFLLAPILSRVFPPHFQFRFIWSRQSDASLSWDIPQLVPRSLCLYIKDFSVFLLLCYVIRRSSTNIIFHTTILHESALIVLVSRRCHYKITIDGLMMKYTHSMI